jgi:hypothetical protein
LIASSVDSWPPWVFALRQIRPIAGIDVYARSLHTREVDGSKPAAPTKVVVIVVIIITISPLSRRLERAGKAGIGVLTRGCVGDSEAILARQPLAPSALPVWRFRKLRVMSPLGPEHGHAV